MAATNASCTLRINSGVFFIAHHSCIGGFILDVTLRAKRGQPVVASRFSRKGIQLYTLLRGSQPILPPGCPTGYLPSREDAVPQSNLKAAALHHGGSAPVESQFDLKF